jgi:hypothetical protein
MKQPPHDSGIIAVHHLGAQGMGIDPMERAVSNKAHSPLKFCLIGYAYNVLLS